MYQEKVLITSNDVDNHLNLKVPSIFRLMQMVSTNHSEKLSLGQKDTIDKGLCWVIIRSKVVIYKYPKMNDEIVVTTHPGEVNKFLFPRFYAIYDHKGNLLISGSSIWVLVDIKTRRLVTRPFEGRTFPSETHKDDIGLPEKLNLPQLDKIEDRKVRYNDIDLNGHLNNTKYIDYIIDTKNKEFYDEFQVKSVNICYDKEIREGETISLYSDNEDNFSIRGEKDGLTCFSAFIEVEKRSK